VESRLGGVRVTATSADSEIREVLDQMIEAMNSGDRDRLRTVVAQRPDAVHIGSDPDEWMTAEEAVETVGGGEALGVKVVVDDFTVHGETNDVAWAVGHGHFEDKSGGSTRPIRMSAVLVRDADRWTVVHSHASIGVPNAEIFG
jgi:ketosteroid isomerase-like protein